MAHLKRSIVGVQAEEICLAHTLIIANAKIDVDMNYKAYIQDRIIRHVVHAPVENIGIDLSKRARVPELVRIQEKFRSKNI